MIAQTDLRFDVETFVRRHGLTGPMNAAGGGSAATLLVCVTCKSDEGPMGAGLFEALGERLAAEPDIALEAVECLAVCKRPCTVALAGTDKWTYVVGDLEREIASRRYRRRPPAAMPASPEGIVPWRERPLAFRKGVVSRIPPLALADNSSDLKDWLPDARQGALHHRHRLSRRRQDDAGPPPAGERRRAPARR